MEKASPHYDLRSIQSRVLEIGVEAFTRTALDGGRQMGLTTREMISVVVALTRANFYKAMTTHADHRIWQDVYHSPTPTGKEAYIKVTMREHTLVIQFKER